MSNVSPENSTIVNATTVADEVKSAESQRLNFPPAAAVPNQQGPLGIRFDFNDGCRVMVASGDWRIRISDIDTANILFETQTNQGWINSSKRYFVRYRLEVWSDQQLQLSHDYDARDRDVLIMLPVGTLGDTLGWFPYVVKFQAQHQCRLTCAMAGVLIPLLQNAYPAITFVTHEQVIAENFYASYRIGLFFDDEACIHQPSDFRLVGLHRTAAYILAVDPAEQPPRIYLSDDSRPMAERYVCIASQSTCQSKYWNNPNGWREIVRYLQELGYRVICIDQKAVHGANYTWNHIPYGAEDQTGDMPLQQRARWLKHADFFIGLSSGLSWLAWAMRTPVVMISGMTHPSNEFYTPFRVINYHACNSCWQDARLRFDHHDFFWCPRHKDTSRQFECTRLITAEAVKQVLRKIPGFANIAVNGVE